MKKLRLLLVLLLVLTGCTQEEIPATKAQESTTPAPTDMGLYIPESQRQGLRTYRMDEPVLHLVQLEQDVLVVSTTADNLIRMRILSGLNGVVRSEKVLEMGATVNTGFQAGPAGISYYNALEQRIVILDLNLMERSRTVLPEQMLGDPAVSPDLKTVYYCTQSQIRALSLETGISRLLKEQNCLWQNPVKLAKNGELLLCYMNDGSQSRISFISTADGRTLAWDVPELDFQGSGSHYFLSRPDGVVTEYLLGDYTDEPQAFVLMQEGRSFQYAQEANAVVSTWHREGVAALEAYSLDSGMCYAAVELPGEDSIQCLTGSDVLWFVACAGEGQTLYRWDTAATPAQGEASVIGQRYTPQAPDEQGLAQCRQMAQTLGEKYGVSIVIDHAALRQPEDYKLTGEHQVLPLTQALEQLEIALARFPEGFFQRIVEDTGSKVLEISLVRDVQGDFAALQYWVGADACLAIEVGQEVEKNFYHELCHVLDAFLYANTRDLDTWNSLNPQGFQYDYSYEQYLNHGQQYLTGPEQAFIDAYSRSFPKEDRASVFASAMLPGSEACFQSETMQKKLHLLSYSIRSAFGWKRDSRSFPWEQYLQEPLAYVKKK